MRIRIWNAYASNNSGAYTIVGHFASDDDAAAAVARLGPVLAAHTAWLDDQQRAGESPLAAFARAEGVPAEAAEGDWPEYGEPQTPLALAVGSQVVIHHPYTVSLPRFFGYWMYARGGRVSAELIHAHAPLVAVLRAWWPWNSPDAKRSAELAAALRCELDAPDGVVRGASADGIDAVVRVEEGPLHGVLVATVFTDLIAGAAGVRDVAQRHRARLTVEVVEAVGEDALAPYRA